MPKSSGTIIVSFMIAVGLTLDVSLFIPYLAVDSGSEQEGGFSFHGIHSFHFSK
jgi:hypothetical protein